MILYRWQGIASNFGDELNTVLWPRLLPDFFDGDPAVRFLGIGSILDRRHSSQAIKLVAGSGYGGYEHKPHIDHSWVIHWVRGPRTAAALGLPAKLALGDPAILIAKTVERAAPGGHDIGFMPHFESAAWGAWAQAAAVAGLRLIDPRDPPLAILDAIGRCKVLLSEAMHGVIAADSLRVPWIAIRPQARVHRAKWWDWAETLDLVPRFHVVPASTMSEWAATSHLSTFHATRTWLRRQELRLGKMTSERRIARAGIALRLAASAAPQLSSDAALDRCQSRMLDAVRAVRTDPLRHLSRVNAVSASQSCLQASGDSAYQLTSTG